MNDDKDYGWHIFGVVTVALLGIPLLVLIVYTIRFWM